jgi:hypothetical protein
MLKETKFRLCPSTSYNLHQESFSTLSFFSPSHLEGNVDDNHDPRAHICVWGGEFCQVSIFANLICQIVGGHFFSFCQNYIDVKLICQIVGVDVMNINLTK